ncbi:hypothetical protein CJF25_14155 [Photobacterium phosphoreum]|uniref:glycosyltransferase n=1 Tax=Photobacterium phosphoreum TaxID=659 RepID=UPI001E5820DC|nr:glycosyltransferase [Photobacterium phosphoreum]MCD9464114.1 hypothetical protein [Photobacterium phosphoreum]
MEIKKLSALSSEDEIKKYWKYTDKVYISCVCITFNQKDYIRDAIDSFLAQETEYYFEIIIHDDVSTDGTRDILLEYKNKYPSIIKLVLQDENQYKLGKKITPLAVSYASGEYIALCEGDDFWIDKQKLQKQITELEKNKNIKICFTSAYSLYPNGKVKVINNYKNTYLVKFENIILGGGGYMPTASILIKREVYKELPLWFYSAPVGDYYIQMLGGLNGAIYLSDQTSAYRISSVGSWSSNRNINKINEDYDRHLIALNFLFDGLGYNNSQHIKNNAICKIMLGKAHELILKSKYFDAWKLIYEYYPKYQYKSVKYVIYLYFPISMPFSKIISKLKNYTRVY